MKSIIQTGIFIILAGFFSLSCNNNEKKHSKNTNKKNVVTEKKENSKETNIEAIVTETNLVLLETKFGNMKIKLYDETPKHKENFLKLVNQSFYDNLLFHRVIYEFMIQGGDPESKNASPETMLGNGGPGYQIDAEFNDSLFHKKGVLSAAREPDQVNPEKKSSGSQFYIVQGKKYTEEELVYMEEQTSINDYIMTHVEIQNQLTDLQKAQDRAGINNLIEEIKTKKDFVLNKIPDFKRKIYKDVGGTPFLDNNYTVFGEVVEGIEVIDRIAGVKTNKNDRPLDDIKMKITIIK